MAVVREYRDGNVLVRELDRDKWPFEVYIVGYGYFKPDFRGAAADLEGALKMGARHDYCRQFDRKL